jgi:hypothetical protein
MRYASIIFSIVFLAFVFGCDGDMASSESLGGTGQGGSMTRFAIQGNRMYVVDHSVIKVFDISADNFRQLSATSVGFGLETIFAKGEYLYLGANDAMYIYSIANPDQPSFIFRYSHIVSCDPVVVQGNRAYVTMRGGTWCNLGSNALEIIDIQDPYNPKLIANYPMDSPHGLAVDGSLLFLCEGENGFKVFDITNERDIKLQKHIENHFAYDVIARSGVATVTGEDGIFQYLYGAQSELQLLSKIPVAREEL